MKSFKEIKEEIANISAGIGVRGFGDVSGTPKVGDETEDNPHIERVTQGAEEYKNLVKQFGTNSGLLDDDPEDDSWWAKSGAKGSALTSLGKPKKGNSTEDSGLKFDTVTHHKHKGIIAEEDGGSTVTTGAAPGLGDNPTKEVFVDKKKKLIWPLFRRLPLRLEEVGGGVAAPGGNTTGGGYVAGAGAHLEGKPSNWSEPGVSKKKQGEHKILTRAKPNEVGSPMKEIPIQEEIERGVFAGEQTFIVPSHVFEKAVHAKQKGKHWRTYIKDEAFHPAIRKYAYESKGPIIFEDKKTGYMTYARYGRKKK